MKLYNIYRTLHLAAVLLVVSSCSKDAPMPPADTEQGQPIAISITDNGYASDTRGAADAPDTRTMMLDYSSVFTEGDVCGLFVVRGTQTVYSNVKLTAEKDATSSGIVWKPESGTTVLGGLPDEHYYLYYPYQADMTGKTAASTGSALTDAEFFAPLIASWQPQKDQSTYAAYTASDLMTAKGTASTDANNTLQLSFSMAHRMALAVVELPTTIYKFSHSGNVIPDYVISTSAQFDADALPYAFPDGVYRYIVNPAEGAVLSAYDDGQRYEFSIKIAHHQQTGGSYKIYKVDGGRVEKPYVLHVGDYFLADGHLLPKDTDEAKVRAAKVVGIVFQTAPYRIGEAEKKALGGKAHALVMCVKSPADASWGTYHDTENLAYCDSKASHYNDISGYGNSEHIRTNRGSLDDYPAFKAAIDFNTVVPVPATTTGWYLPAVGQWWDIMQNLGGCPALALSDEQTSSETGIWGFKDQGDVVAALNNRMKYIADKDKTAFDNGRYWTASEARGAGVIWSVLNNSYVGRTVGVKYNHPLKVRPVLAF